MGSWVLSCFFGLLTEECFNVCEEGVDNGWREDGWSERLVGYDNLIEIEIDKTDEIFRTLRNGFFSFYFFFFFVPFLVSEWN